MLDMEMARKAYQERIDSKSYSDRNYTEEEKSFKENIEES
ncbi:hypothetical protein SN811_17940 [Ligilactobacillus agilis]|uniref:Uncharacterized protein n=1 Tax=Ligilactobacillus agilis TaxID=1601 RepID=A0A6F9Y6V4_9LACO|nr:hypothetical protein SN811_17940 [Ligilactobacillus agilis]